MDSLLRTDSSGATSVQSSFSPSHTPSPALSSRSAPPTNDDIEAIIQMATSSRSSPDGKGGPLRDTRTQLFVGNLPYRVRWQDLKDLFRKAGTVLRADVSLGPDNRSRGYGTVLLATAEDAGRAVDMFNGFNWQTRVLEVRPDRLPPDLDYSNPASQASSSPSNGTFSPAVGPPLELDYHNLMASSVDRPHSSSGGRNLFVGNLPFHCQWQDLKDLFRQAGTIIRADVALGQDGRSRGFGTVVFATEYDADRAVKMFNGFEYNGRQLKVHYDKFTQTGQAPTAPASPNPSQAYAHQSGIVLPTGYALDFGSAPSTPYGDYPPQLQMPMPHPQHTQSHILSPHFSMSRQSSNTGSSLVREVKSLSETMQSTSISSVNESRPSLSAHNSGSSNSKNSPAHPHHPGPISLPPPPAVGGFSMPMHNMSPGMVPISPMYHPGMSPLHHPGMMMTPHGLPPITPSMPPFTFVQPMPSPSAHPGMPNPDPSQQQQQQQQQMHGLPQTPGGPPPFTLHMPPQPSPGFQPPHLFTPFSPGLTMSPGAFWGRPGMNGAGPNPYINPAVGAPVHVMPSPGGFFMPVSPGHMTDMSGIQQQQQQQQPQEPRGYFDAYFGSTPSPPPSTGGLTVESEILKEKKKGSPLRGKTGIASPEDESIPPRDASSTGQELHVPRSNGKRAMSVGDAPKWKHDQRSPVEVAVEDGDEPGLLEDFQKKNHVSDSLRTYSMSSSESSSKRPFFSRPDSDPTLPSTAATSVTSSDEDLTSEKDDKTPSNEVPSRTALR